MIHTGKLGTVTISARSAIIARFTDGQVLDFPTIQDAQGFLEFYHRSVTARTQNPAKIYSLKDDIWAEETAGAA